MMVGEGAERLALEDPPLQLVIMIIIMTMLRMMMLKMMMITMMSCEITPLNLKYYQQAGRADLVTKAGEEEWER